MVNKGDYRLRLPADLALFEIVEVWDGDGQVIVGDVQLFSSRCRSSSTPVAAWCYHVVLDVTTQLAVIAASLTSTCTHVVLTHALQATAPAWVPAAVLSYIGLIHFLSRWCKRPLNQALVSFAFVCAYVSSIPAWLFRFLCCFWL